MSPNTDKNNPKFTRGEKCIFFHIIITLAIISILVSIYVVHVCLVKHAGKDYYILYRKPQENGATSRRAGHDLIEYQSVGLAYINITPTRLICNTLLLATQWSLAPAQCTAMMEDPDMANFMPMWRLQYKKDNGKYFVSEIKRSVTHPNFNRDDFSNNVGLFRHEDHIPMPKYILRKGIHNSDAVLKTNIAKMNIFMWDWRNQSMEATIKPVRPLFKEKCLIFIAPLIDKLRKYEFCVTFEPSGSTLDHGAMFVVDRKIIGFFSWGDIGGRGVPLVILNASQFKDWFEPIISL